MNYSTLSDGELSAAVAQIAGWREAFPKAGPPHPETRKGGILLPYYWVNENTHERRMEVPPYATDANAVLGLLKRSNFDAVITFSNTCDTWFVRLQGRFISTKEYHSEGPTFARAACLALLAAAEGGGK
jgi:hypothetical protein